MGLRWSLSRGSQFKLHFLLGVTEKPRIAPKFSRYLFCEGLLINNTKLWYISKRIICMANTNMTKETTTKLKIKHTYVSGLFDKLSLFTKINLKKPLSRGSRFKIYFHLKGRGNRGSHQNFHGIHFSKDRILIKSDHFITYHLMTTCLSKKQTIYI